MGEARKRFAKIVGDGAAKVAALSDAQQAELHETAAAAASAINGMLTAMIALEESSNSDHGQGANAVLSGAVHGLAHVAWKMRRKNYSRQDVESLLMTGIRHALEQAQARELMGGPVAGNG